MTSLASVFVDDDSVIALEARVPNAIVNSGMFGGGSCACGIGISTENPNLEQSLPNWTLLDQHGNARAAQISQMIGGSGISDAGTSSGEEGTLPDATIRLVIGFLEDPTGGGSLSLPALGANLTDLAVGWETGA